jgi:hypothetical protein
VVTAEVASVDGVRAFVENLRRTKVTVKSIVTSAQDGALQQKGLLPGETPEARIEARAELPQGSLAKGNVLAFKDGIPQILHPTALKVTDTLLLLLFALETGLRNTNVSYDSFTDLYEAQNVKSGSPLSMSLTNLRNGGYLDKKVYKTSRSLRLTAKGEKKAINMLKGPKAE